MMVKICRLVLVVALVVAPTPVLAFDGALSVSQQEGSDGGAVELASTAPAGDLSVGNASQPEILAVYETHYITEVVTVEQIVPVTETVLITEVVTVEQIVPVTETVLITEVVTVEQIVPVTETVLITEIVPLTETIILTETVVVTETVLVTEVVTESVASEAPPPVPSGAVEADVIEAPVDVAEPQATVTPSVTPTVTMTTTTGVTSTANPASRLTHWTQLKPPYSEPTPLPVSGLAMYYAPNVMDSVAAYRERVNKIEQCEECIGQVALLRAGDIGRQVWIQVGDQAVEGPFQVLDVAGRHHIPDLLRRNWVVDVDYDTALRWGMRGPIEVTIYDEAQDKIAIRPSTQDDHSAQ
jgi:hypothetical protein